MAALTAADVGHVHADEIDHALLDERHVLVHVDEEFTHGDGHGGVVADVLEVVVLLRRQRVLEEKEAVGLELLGQPDGLRRVEALVHVVAQLDLVPELLPRVLEQRRRLQHVCAAATPG